MLFWSIWLIVRLELSVKFIITLLCAWFRITNANVPNIRSSTKVIVLTFLRVICFPKIMGSLPIIKYVLLHHSSNNKK